MIIFIQLIFIFSVKPKTQTPSESAAGIGTTFKHLPKTQTSKNFVSHSSTRTNDLRLEICNNIKVNKENLPESPVSTVKSSQALPSSPLANPNVTKRQGRGLFHSLAGRRE